jgi:hypothetical protein
MSGLRRVIIAACLCLALRGATPIPKVMGPLPQSADNHAFGGAEYARVPEDLKKIGYVEEEFLISGTANVYDWPASGPAIVRSANAPYVTRVLVRRPEKRSQFSGNVIVEMMNPSNLFDLNIGWAISHKEMVHNGDAWVALTAKPIAIEALKNFNPKRYADLAWNNPLPLDDPKNCATVARDSQRTTENGLVWDMHTQTGAWLRSTAKSNPLNYGAGEHTNPVRHVIAWGYSQTGSFLYTYVNAIHPLDVKSNGHPIFDAYSIAVASGPSAINQCAAPIPANDPRRTIHNAGVPVIRIMSQSDYLRSIAARLPDSDEPGNQSRNYEIAGSGHATPDELAFAASPEDIVKANREVPPMDCNEGPRSRFPSSIAYNAILRNLELWIDKGTAPPRADQIVVENNAPVLDKFGNVTGGVRSPFLDVPTSTWFGNSTGKSFCTIAGHEVPFDARKLHELYPTHASYVQAVTKDVADLVAKRFITRQDGDALIADAKKADVPPSSRTGGQQR